MGPYRMGGVYCEDVYGVVRGGKVRQGIYTRLLLLALFMRRRGVSWLVNGVWRRGMVWY